MAWPGELDPVVLVVLGDPPERDHPGVRDEHGDAVNPRPQPRVLLGRRVVEDQVGLQGRAEAVADDRDRDVDTQWHPVLVERDQADHDEEVEVGLDRAVRDHDECDRAVGQAAGVEHGGQPPPVPEGLAGAQQHDRR